MENSQRIRVYVIAFTTVAVIHSAASQAQFSNGNPGIVAYPQSQNQPKYQQTQECGTQDKDLLPDFHAAAPWAAALFYVEGDYFQNNIKPQYLSTAIFISPNLAITSGSKILAQQQTGLQTKLQLYYGHRALGKQTIIRIRKVELLSPPRQPLALKVDTSPAISRVSQSQPTPQNTGKFGENSDLYLLHLESTFDITPYSRFLCVNENSFLFGKQYAREAGSINKIHISGYAAKNETNGPHVVYFSGNREWQVNSWDTDKITVNMQDRPVTYDFLPKHFNAGSALTVKVNNQFFLAGLLIRSSGSQTIFRSLEKFVELIQFKEREYAPTPVTTTSSGLQLQYDINSNNGNSNNQNNGNIGYDRYSVQQQQNSNNNHQVSNVDAQISHLEKAELEEKQQIRNPSYGQQQSSSNTNAGSSGSNWGNSPKPTSRPDYAPTVSTRPSIYTQRPDVQYVPQAQAAHHYNQNPVPIQTSSNDNGRYQESYQAQRQPVRQAEPPYIYPPTTTTVRSQFPPYIQQYNDGQRQSEQMQQQLQRQQQQFYQNIQNNVKCTHEYLERGVDFECFGSGKERVSNEDCLKAAPVNTTIRLSCKSHYEPLDGERSIEKTCDSSGNWLPRITFTCKPECGNVGKSVPFVVHGSKTPSGKWPWHAALFKRVNHTSYTYICGATLITRSMLVTAAHCVAPNGVNGGINPALYKVVVGAISSDLLANRKDTQAQEFDIKEIRVNKHYNQRNFEADIALVHLDRSVLLSEYVRPICFPFPSDKNKQISSYQLSEGTSGIVVGFGTTSEDWKISKDLRMASLPVVSVHNCTNVLQTQPSTTQYCAGYTNGTSVCEGDSGGAHIFSDQFSKRYYIQGVISHGNRKDTTVGNSRCDHEKYTVFTKVSSYAEWVKDLVYDLDFDYNSRRRRRK